MRKCSYCGTIGPKASRGGWLKCSGCGAQLSLAEAEPLTQLDALAKELEVRPDELARALRCLIEHTRQW